jgi:PAS domain S-box-containing protein
MVTRSVNEHKVPENIRWQRDFYEALLEAQSDVGEGLLFVEDGRIHYVNEAFCLISGYSATELTALPTFLDLVAPDERQIIEDWVHRRLRGERVESCYEAVILHKSGRNVNVDVAISTLAKENRLPQFVAIVRDITARRRSEARLTSSLAVLVAVHEAGRALNSTLEQKEIGKRLLGIMLRVCELNAAVINLQDIGGRSDVLAVVGSETFWRGASATAEAQVARLRALRSKEHQVFRLGRPEESDIPWLALCLPLVIQGRVIGVLEAYGPEALAEKATLETLESLARQGASALENARLYQKVAKQKRQLEDLVGKLLVAREEERRRVAYDVHDGLTQLAFAAHQNLQAYVDDRPTESHLSQMKLDRALDLVKRTVEEARRVIATLRPPALDNLGLAVALRSQLDSLKVEGWDVAFDEDLWVKRLPPDIEAAIYGIAQEALTNVRKHSGTTLVHVTLTQLGKRICLRVRDWGRGFDGALPPGVGNALGERVGLCSMQERVALLGGECVIHSQPGAGTCVVAEIPLPDDTLAQGKQILSPQNMTSPSRLLIADDHALAREGLRTLLTSEPDLQIVGEAANGREALELCRRLRPDLVLMDARMPKMDGLKAARAIKVEYPATIILVLTAYEDPDYLLEAIRAGVSGYVIKDATKHNLISSVRGALSGDHPLHHDLAMQLLQSLANEDGQESGHPRGSGKRAELLPELLTPRELEVLRLLAQGQTNRQISQVLVVSPATVKVHVEHILEKLKVADRTQAAVRASEIGLLDPRE